MAHMVYFNSREACRACNAGRMVDNGKDAPKGQRYARALSGISGNSRQRRQAIRRMMREA